MSDVLFFVGAFTDGAPYFPGARGEGIVTGALDTATGRVTHRHTYREILNPDYLAYDPTRRWLFAISDNLTAPGHVCAFRVTADGRLELLNRQSSRAPVTCHVCVGCDEVYTASYMESCVTVHAITPAGVGELRQEFRYHGSGPNTVRQEASHAHQAALTPDGRQLFVCDLGADKIWVHRVGSRGAEGAPTFFPMPAGCGPRHLVFHPTLPVAYLLCELNGHVIVFNRQSGAILADIPAGAPAAAAIRLRGATLLTSNRTDHSLAQFHLDTAGLPTFARRLDSAGLCPRDFNIDPTGRWVVVACQESHALMVIELATGAVVARCPVNSPACVVFAE